MSGTKYSEEIFMFLILTMAGLYHRFTKEGFNTPKYLLPWGERTILAVILDELNRENFFSNVLLVANQRDNPYMPHVHAVMKRHNIKIENLILTPDTSGQAETAMVGVNALESLYGEIEQPIIFHNIDTILLNRNINEIKHALKFNSGYIDIFEASHKEYSYVLTDKDKKVTEITEKIIVSDLATSGLYGFQNLAIYKKYASTEDVYISSVFKKMILDGKTILASNKHNGKETIVLGYPAEYMNASLTLL